MARKKENKILQEKLIEIHKENKKMKKGNHTDYNNYRKMEIQNGINKSFWISRLVFL